MNNTLRGVNFSYLPDLSIEEFLALEDPCVIFETEHTDSDGVLSYLYTVGGWLNGTAQGGIDHKMHTAHGCTVGGDVIVVQAATRAEADAMAADGLEHTRAKLAEEATLKEGIDGNEDTGIITVAGGRRIG